MFAVSFDVDAFLGFQLDSVEVEILAGTVNANLWQTDSRTTKMVFLLLEVSVSKTDISNVQDALFASEKRILPSSAKGRAFLQAGKAKAHLTRLYALSAKAARRSIVSVWIAGLFFPVGGIDVFFMDEKRKRVVSPRL